MMSLGFSSGRIWVWFVHVVVLVSVSFSVKVVLCSFDHFAISSSESFLIISLGYSLSWLCWWCLLGSTLVFVCFVCQFIISTLVSFLIFSCGCSCSFLCWSWVISSCSFGGVCVSTCVCSSSCVISCDVTNLVIGLCSTSVIFAVFDCRSLIAFPSSCVDERVG